MSTEHPGYTPGNLPTQLPNAPIDPATERLVTQYVLEGGRFMEVAALQMAVAAGLPLRNSRLELNHTSECMYPATPFRFGTSLVPRATFVVSHLPLDLALAKPLALEIPALERSRLLLAAPVVDVDAAIIFTEHYRADKGGVQVYLFNMTGPHDQPPVFVPYGAL